MTGRMVEASPQEPRYEVGTFSKLKLKLIDDADDWVD
jgi:hypothetical protein